MSTFLLQNTDIPVISNTTKKILGNTANRSPGLGGFQLNSQMSRWFLPLCPPRLGIQQGFTPFPSPLLPAPVMMPCYAIDLPLKATIPSSHLFKPLKEKQWKSTNLSPQLKASSAPLHPILVRGSSSWPRNTSRSTQGYFELIHNLIKWCHKRQVEPFFNVKPEKTMLFLFGSSCTWSS